MPERNTPQNTLESWKQIAAYLDRSERTVRRWEAAEGLPIHRRGHQKYDTVFAYKHEIEAWGRRRTRFGNQVPAVARAEAHEPCRTGCLRTGIWSNTTRLPARWTGMWPVLAPATAISCVRRFTGKPRCPAIAWAQSTVDLSSMSSNGLPQTARAEHRAAVRRIEIIETIALVHLEVRGWSGKLAGVNSRASDVFTLLKLDGEWKITHKLFHWHSD